MDPPDDHIPLSHRRRMMVKAVLSPPTLSIPLLFPSRNVDPNSSAPSHNKTQKTCRLCGSDNALLEPEMEVAKMVKGMMGQVGLALSEEDLNFCPFCSSQLQSLVRLKKEMDRLGDRLCSMILGLLSLFSQTTPLKQDEENISPAANKAIPYEDNWANNNTEMNTEKPKSPQPFKSTRNFVHRQEKMCTKQSHKGKSTTSSRDSTHLPVAERPYTCSMCPRRFSQKQNLKVHMYTHLPIHLRPFPCPHCPSRFYRKDVLKRHVLLQHKDQPQVAMPGTVAPFGHETAIQGTTFVHPVAEIHSSVASGFLMESATPKNSCHICDETFSRRSFRKGHLLCVHGVTLQGKGRKSTAKCHSRRYACSVCSRRFRNSSNLKLHAMSHTGERPYACRICGVRFPLKWGLLRHFYTHLPKEEWPFPCPHCPRRFIQMSYLDNHVKTHVPPDQTTSLSSSEWRPKPLPDELWRTGGNETRGAADDDEESKAGGFLVGEVDFLEDLDQTGSIINIGICHGLEEVANSNDNLDGIEVDKHKLEYRIDSPSTHWKDFQEEL